MSNFLKIHLLFIVFILSGCAPFNISDLVNSQNPKLYSGTSDIQLDLSYANDKDYRKRNCRDVWLSNDTKVSYETIYEKSSESHSFYIDTPLRHFEGIKNILVKDGKLHIHFFGKAEVEEYSAPIYRTIHQEHFEARPTGTLIWSAVGLGLPLLLSPSNTVKRAFGCTDETVKNKYANVTYKNKTGNKQWTDFHKTQQLTISGLDNQIEVTVVPNTLTGVAVVDLSDLIAKTNLLDISNLIIDCTTCVVELDKEQTIISLASKKIAINHDFRPYKNAIQVHNQTQVTNTESPSSNKFDETNRSPVATNKIASHAEKCKRLGLTPGSEDFVLCLKSLGK